MKKWMRLFAAVLDLSPFVSASSPPPPFFGSFFSLIFCCLSIDHIFLEIWTFSQQVCLRVYFRVFGCIFHFLHTSYSYKIKVMICSFNFQCMSGGILIDFVSSGPPKIWGILSGIPRGTHAPSGILSGPPKILGGPLRNLCAIIKAGEIKSGPAWYCHSSYHAYLSPGWKEVFQGNRPHIFKKWKEQVEREKSGSYVWPFYAL